MSSIEPIAQRSWSMTGANFEMLTLAYALSLELAGPEPEDRISLQIETQFTLIYDDHILDVIPEKPETVVPMLALLRKPLKTFTAFANGRLWIEFEDGTLLEVPKHEKYESWNTYGYGAYATANMLCSAHDGPPWGDSA
jgi:hypothetical protein